MMQKKYIFLSTLSAPIVGDTCSPMPRPKEVEMGWYAFLKHLHILTAFVTAVLGLVIKTGWKLCHQTETFNGGEDDGCCLSFASTGSDFLACYQQTNNLIPILLQ